MASVADLVEDSAMKQLATGDAYTRGNQLAAQGAVQFVTFEPVAVTAHVEDGESYMVDLLRTDGDTLAWSCGCLDGLAGAFCRHCVAAGRETWLKSPKRHH